MNPVLVVKNLRKIYGAKTPFVAVDEISFQMQPGEILGLLGPNGSGKTTTIQMLLGTLAPTSGDILYFGKDFVQNRSEVLQHISFASTYTSLPFLLTIAENLSFFGRLHGLTPKEMFQRADPLLERFGILDKKNARVSSLSAGQITRLMLVKAFLIHPKVVLLDEPTASLDPDMAQEVCSYLLEQREKMGLSILFTSHKMDEVTQVCDRVIFLKKGKIVADDLPANLAKSVSLFRLRLTIADGAQRAAELAKKQQLSFQLEPHSLELAVDETQIPLFLTALTKEQIFYSKIQIEEPSLEDYFLQIADRQSPFKGGIL